MLEAVGPFRLFCQSMDYYFFCEEGGAIILFKLQASFEQLMLGKCLVRQGIDS